LEHESDIEVVGEAGTGRQAVQLARSLHAAVVVMDIAMPLLNGLDATRQIRKASPAPKVLILSAHGDEAYVRQVTHLDASGFLLKQTSAHDLATAIREVQKGRTCFSIPISERLQGRSPGVAGRHGARTNHGNSLSSREAEVLQLIAEGKPNKQIASELGVSFKTADKHRQHLMSKLNLHDIAALTRYAIKEGIIEADVEVTMV
jgi:DNA-binding NarL/FixJ family response regulator